MKAPYHCDLYNSRPALRAAVVALNLEPHFTRETLLTMWVLMLLERATQKAWWAKPMSTFLRATERGDK